GEQGRGKLRRFTDERQLSTVTRYRSSRPRVYSEVARVVLVSVMAALTLLGQPGGPDAILERAREVTGMTKPAGRVLHWRDQEGAEQTYQSTPPYLTILYSHETWFDTATGVERSSNSMMSPGRGPLARGTVLRTADAVFAVQNGKAARAPGSP